MEELDVLIARLVEYEPRGQSFAVTVKGPGV